MTKTCTTLYLMIVCKRFLKIFSLMKHNRCTKVTLINLLKNTLFLANRQVAPSLASNYSTLISGLVVAIFLKSLSMIKLNRCITLLLGYFLKNIYFGQNYIAFYLMTSSKDYFKCFSLMKRIRHTKIKSTFSK